MSGSDAEEFVPSMRAKVRTRGTSSFRVQASRTTGKQFQRVLGKESNYVQLPETVISLHYGTRS